jgi:hypothetical protein
VRLSPLGTSDFIWPRKSALVPLCPPQIPQDDLGSNPGHRGGKPTANRLSYGTASIKLTTNIHLVPKCGAIPPLSEASLRCGV